MSDIPAVRIIQGSNSDRSKTNIILKVLKEIGIPYNVSTASCHWNTFEDPISLEEDCITFEEFIEALGEELIAYVGGMQFAAPGIAETINKVSADEQSYKIILAVPTDKIARHACEDFPQGTAIFTAGFNSIDINHGLKNSALGIAKLYAWKYPEFRPALQKYFNTMRANKQLVEEVELVDGLIPEPEPKQEGGK